jgi:hypothetical protein
MPSSPFLEKNVKNVKNVFIFLFIFLLISNRKFLLKEKGVPMYRGSIQHETPN